jgi:hypothetical protein
MGFSHSFHPLKKSLRPCLLENIARADPGPGTRPFLNPREFRDRTFEPTPFFWLELFWTFADRCFGVLHAGQQQFSQLLWPTGNAPITVRGPAGRDLVSMALRNALRRAASAAPWATAAPWSLKRPELCRTLWSASCVRRLAPGTPNAACWKGGRSFAAAAECASRPFTYPATNPARLQRRESHVTEYRAPCFADGETDWARPRDAS